MKINEKKRKEVKWKMWNMECGIWNVEYGMWNMEYLQIDMPDPPKINHSHLEA